LGYDFLFKFLLAHCEILLECVVTTRLLYA
jgi:hypothetical protein